ncbi:MAG: denitrification regulatory protein NirQ [uncultured bacterium]|nr:MAG: denitrification regulatory protein NirQ [uncultured bacterium]KKT76999.1 MAG: hypothetical protein UW70_C0006G0005 [Candidatus Peregrinibacteria bacterium GW2011_GWA2_44_7]
MTQGEKKSEPLGLEKPLPKSFQDSGVGKDVLAIINPTSTTDESVQVSDLPAEELRFRVLQARALLARLRVLEKPSGGNLTSGFNVDPSIQVLLDADLVDDIREEMDPLFVSVREYEETTAAIRGIFSNQQVIREYARLYDMLYIQIHKVKDIVKAYHNHRQLSQTERIALVSQLSRLLHNLIQWCDEESQNIHNQVSREKRGYRPSDRLILEKLKRYKDQCNQELDQILSSDVEAKIQLRRDRIKLNRSLLKRHVPKEIAERNSHLIEGGYILTPSRESLLFGSIKSPDASIMAALRNRSNVELFGPTGTGKTKLAEYAAHLFSGKPGDVVPGNSGLSKYDLLGKTVGLDKRDFGAFIKCLKEGRVMIIDEDNLIDPRVIAVVKHPLGLKVGDLYIHPETGEEIPVPPGFGIIVTRNEKGKHHKLRNELPPEYRREFVHGSFEVGYFTEDEMYDEFLIPKLTENNGSSILSVEEIGGELNKPDTHSPLLSLVRAAKEIQKLYKDNKIADGVMESGFLIGLFDDWPQQHITTNCTFLEYLENRLLGFIRRSIGNPARKLIIKALVEKGFFVSKGPQDFVTQDEGQSVDQAELDSYRGKTTATGATGGRRSAASTSTSATSPVQPIVVFPKPETPMDARAVARLDPFGKRKLEITPHPLEKEINDFKKAYNAFCSLKGIPPVTFVAHNFQDSRTRIVENLKTYVKKTKPANDGIILGLLDDCLKPTAEKPFMADLKEILDMLS